MPDPINEQATTDDISPGLREMAGVLLTEQTLDAILELIATLAKEAISGTRGVSVSLMREGDVATVAHSDELSRILDGDQYATGEGPCLEAMRTGDVISVDDMAQEKRWPSFTPRAREQHIVSSLSMPLKARGNTIGALNFYSMSEGNFANAVSKAHDFSRHATVILSNAQAYATSQQLNEQLHEALKTRETIGQAIGILMEREGLDAEAAFAMLRKASQTRNVKVRTIATELVHARGSRTFTKGHR
jgi:GAF domain-containing protein